MPAIRVKTSAGWQDIAIVGPPGAKGDSASIFPYTLIDGSVNAPDVAGQIAFDNSSADLSNTMMVNRVDNNGKNQSAVLQAIGDPDAVVVVRSVADYTKWTRFNVPSIPTSQSYGYRFDSVVPDGNGPGGKVPLGPVELIYIPLGPEGPQGTVYDSDQIGVVKGWSGKTIPTNWKLADGARYTQAAFPQGYDFAKQEADAGNPLWTYRTTPDISFTVPNLNDKFLLTLGTNTIGLTGGEVSHILTPGETAMKAHSHGGNSGDDTPDHQHGYASNPLTDYSGGTTNIGAPTGGAGIYKMPSNIIGGALNRHHHSIPAEVAANGAAHNNMPPYVVVAMIVKIKGAILDPDNAIVGPPGPTGPGVPVGGANGQVLAKQSGTNYDTAWTTPAQGGHTVQDEGAALTTRAGLNFIGSGVAATDDAANNRTNVTISGGGGAGAPEVYIGPDPPTPRDAQVIWVDTDESPLASLNLGMDVWHVVGAAGEPAFLNGYVNTPGGTPMAFRKDPEGRVHIKGAVRTGTNNTSIFTLPSGYRPPTLRYYTCLGDAGAAANYTYVNTAGDVVGSRSGVDLHFGDIELDTETVQQVASLAAQPLDSVHVVGATGEPAFQTGWSAYAANPPQTARFRKYPDGRVRLAGITIANGGFTFASNGNLFVLPAGYRPASNVNVYAMHIDGVDSSIDAVRLIVLTSGQVQMQATTGPSYSGGAGSIILLDGVEFDTETLTTYSTGAIIPSAQSMPVSMDAVHIIGAAGEPAFANGWVNYDVSGLRNARFRKYPDGRVRLSGMIKTGSMGLKAFTLPAGYRPAATSSFATIANEVFGYAYITSAGDVVPQVGSNAYFFLDGIEFDTETTLVTASVAVQPLDRWHAVGGVGEPAFGGSWANYDPSLTGWQLAGFRKDASGRVALKGMVAGGTAAQTIFTLPAGYRPPLGLIFPAANGGAAYSEIRITAAGLVQVSGSIGGWISLDAEFDTETVSNYATAVVQGTTPVITPVVTTLPVSPVDGQECIYRFVPNSTPANLVPVLWHLKWDATTSAWLPVGAQEPSMAAHWSNPTVSMGSGAWGTYDANDPIARVPLAGTYELETGVGDYSPATASSFFLTYTINGGGVQPASLQVANGATPGNMHGRVRIVLAAGDAIRQLYWLNSGGPQNVRLANRYMSLRPVRIG